MNADLEETLEELGPDYREVVARLRDARTVSPRHAARPRVLPSISWKGRTVGGLVAATLALVCGVAFWFLSGRPENAAEPASVAQVASASEASLGTQPYVLALEATPAAIDEILRTQAPDGSWQNDYLTRQNAAVLRRLGRANVAYRKAVRYLRSRGLEPLTEAELRARNSLAKRV